MGLGARIWKMNMNHWELLAMRSEHLKRLFSKTNYPTIKKTLSEAGF